LLERGERVGGGDGCGQDGFMSLLSGANASLPPPPKLVVQCNQLTKVAVVR
jgi:hypothetical protein